MGGGVQLLNLRMRILSFEIQQATVWISIYTNMVLLTVDSNKIEWLDFCEIQCGCPVLDSIPQIVVVVGSW